MKMLHLDMNKLVLDHCATALAYLWLLLNPRRRVSLLLVHRVYFYPWTSFSIVPLLHIAIRF